MTDISEQNSSTEEAAMVDTMAGDDGVPQAGRRTRPRKGKDVAAAQVDRRAVADSGGDKGKDRVASQPNAPANADVPRASQPSKLELLLALLRQSGGATLADLSAATGWQVHSVRGAMAGALRKKGHVVLSEKTGDVRRYRVETPA